MCDCTGTLSTIRRDLPIPVLYETITKDVSVQSRVVITFSLRVQYRTMCKPRPAFARTEGKYGYEYRREMARLVVLNLLPTTYYLLPTTYYLLPTTYYLLPTTYYLLPTTYYLLPTTYYLLPTTYYLLPTTYYLLPTTYYPLPTTHYPLLYEYSTVPTTYCLLPTAYTTY